MAAIIQPGGSVRDAEVIALADVFKDRLEMCRTQLKKVGNDVAGDRCFTGFDAYRKLLAVPEVNYVLHCAPPQFRPAHLRAANLRRAFSAIVAGNVKDHGIRQIDEHGPFALRGDARLTRPLDALLHSFIAQKRMKISGAYRPVYRVVA